MTRVLAASPSPQGVAAAGLGDGPYIDVGVFAADGNVNWDDRVYNGQSGFGGTPGPYLYGAFSTSTIPNAAQYSSRWWWRDFGPGGTWDVGVLHVTGFDVGIYSFELDGRTFATLDGYSLADVNNIRTVVAAGLQIPPGRHRISVTIRSHNAACTGVPWYPALQGMWFRRTGPAAIAGALALPSGRPQAAGGQVITIHPIFATGNTNWDTLAVSNGMISSYELYSTGAQNAARWWDVDLVAGAWDLEIRCATFSAAGIISVQLDDVTLATIDTYSASTVYGVQKTARLLVPKAGTQRLKFLMATKNGSSSAYYGDVSLVQLRQVAPAALSLPHRIVQFGPAWSHGDTNWSTIATNGAAGTANTLAFGGVCQSTGAQHAARWWYVPLTAGTWAFDLCYWKESSQGIYSVRLDDVEVGSIDGYAAAGGTKNVRTTITGIQVSGTGYHKLSLVMASKNASSTNYYGTPQFIGLRRTA